MLVENGGEKVSVLPYGMNADTIVYKSVKMISRPARGTNWHKYWNTLNNN